jgi:hypothetical protein
VCLGLLGCLPLAVSGLAQDTLQQKLAAAQQAAAQNRQALRAYSWLQTMEASYKGEAKKTTVHSCRYAPDGSVQKTLVSSSPAPAQKGGLRGKIAGKKKAEMKDEAESAVELVRGYVPPAPDLIQAAVTAGNASLTAAGPGAVALVFRSYLKPGDSVTLTFEAEVRKLLKVLVTSYLEDSARPMSLEVEMQSLPDGTSYPAVEVLSLPASQLSIRVENGNYQKVAP